MTHPPRPSARRLSLLKPTGHLTLGNYLGALRPMTETSGDCFFGVCNLHAFTVDHDPARVRRLTDEIAGLMLAAGVDPDQVTLFVQSQVPAHAELHYLLECTATVGELGRMIQYKEKGRGRPGTRTSLLTYPVLMGADILLYAVTEVPVGEDQRQHVELTRDLATRFNRTYGDTFVVPEIITPPVAGRVMDLQDPTGKMGKTQDSTAGTVFLLDPPDVVVRKIRRAVTDSSGELVHDRAQRPGVSNLLEITAACRRTSVEVVASECTSYGDLKAATTDAVLAVLEPLQKRYAEREVEEVRAVFAAGSARAREAARPVLDAARAAIGL